MEQPSIKLSNLTIDRKIRTTHDLAGGCKKESVGVVRGEAEEIAEENLNSQIKTGEGE